MTVRWSAEEERATGFEAEHVAAMLYQALLLRIQPYAWGTPEQHATATLEGATLFLAMVLDLIASMAGDMPEVHAHLVAQAQQRLPELERQAMELRREVGA